MMLSENYNMSAECGPPDVAEAESAILKVQENVQDLVVNVDISSIEYNLDNMLEVAAVLGFDDEDFEELGVNLRESRCNAGICTLGMKDIRFKDMMLNSAPMIKTVAKKLKCYPGLKNTDMPFVE